ncbi:hypothetical protein D3C73_1277020 [compost metagenome]
MQTNAGVNDQSVTLPTHDLDADNIKLFRQIQIAPFACRFNSTPRQNFDVYRPKLIPSLSNGTGRRQFKGHIRIKIQDHLPSRARCLHLGNPACKKPMPSEQSSQSIQLRTLQLQRQIAYPIGELLNRSVGFHVAYHHLQECRCFFRRGYLSSWTGQTSVDIHEPFCA